MFEYARVSATFARVRGGVEAGVGESESFTFHGCSVLAAAMVKGQSFPIASLHLPYTPSAVDTIVDLTARYLSLLAERTAYNAFSNHNDLTPDVSDVRMAMQDCALLVPTMTAGEELWKEILRKPLDEYNEETGARENEAARRDAEDTADVTEFIEWVKGDQNKEIRRIAGIYKPVATNPTEQLDQEEMEDYLNSMSEYRVSRLQVH